MTISITCPSCKNVFSAEVVVIPGAVQPPVIVIDKFGKIVWDKSSILAVDHLNDPIYMAGKYPWQIQMQMDVDSNKPFITSSILGQAIKNPNYVKK
jgi:hypothetical protein